MAKWTAKSVAPGYLTVYRDDTPIVSCEVRHPGMGQQGISEIDFWRAEYRKSNRTRQKALAVMVKNLHLASG